MDINNLFDDFNILDNTIPTKNNVASTGDLFDIFDQVNEPEEEKASSFGFYISLMGINPTIILKEDLNVLINVLIMYGRHHQIKYLFQNLRDFIPVLNTNILSISEPNKITYAQNLIKDYTEKVNKLINTFTSKTNLDFFSDSNLDIEIDIPSIFQRESKSTQIMDKIQTVRSDTNLERLIESDKKYIDSLVNRIDFVFYHKKILDTNREIDIVIQDYLKRDYTYSKEEIEIMEILKFPPIYNNESFIKDKVVTSTTPSTDIDRDYKIVNYNKTLYSKILNLKSLKTEKGIQLVKF